MSLLAWILPPFRQYKGDYFYLFLVFALLDPLTLIVSKLVGFNYYIYVFGTGIVIFSLIKKHSLKSSLMLTFLFLIIAAVYITKSIDPRFLIILEHFIIIYLILLRTINSYMKFQKVQQFHIVLLVYFLSLVIKFFFIILNKTSGILFFYSTTFFEIFIAIYFFIVRAEEKDKSYESISDM